MGARLSLVVRASAVALVGLLGVVPASVAIAAESAPSASAARGVVTAAELTKTNDVPPATAPVAANDAKVPSATQPAVKASTKSSRNQRRAAKRKAPPREKRMSAVPATAAAAAAATAAAVASSKAEATPAEPAEKARPALIVDGTSAASQQAADAAKAPEIEVRVSATQKRENLYRNAANAISEGRIEEGVRQLQQILAEHPGQDNARQILIGVALRSRQFARAEALADERLAHGNEHLGFAVVSARLKLDRSDPVAALDVLKRSEVHAGSNPEYQALMAAVLQRLSRHGEAAERFRAALALQPGTGIWQMGLGVSLQALERPVEAIEAYRRARDGTGLSPELRAFVDERVAELQR